MKIFGLTKTLDTSVPSVDLCLISDLLVLLLLPPSQSWIIEPPQKFPLSPASKVRKKTITQMVNVKIIIKKKMVVQNVKYTLEFFPTVRAFPPQGTKESGLTG